MTKHHPDRPEYVVAACGVPVLWTDSFEEACEALEEPGTVPFDAQRVLDLTFDELVARDPEGYRAWLLAST